MAHNLFLRAEFVQPNSLGVVVSMLNLPLVIGAVVLFFRLKTDSDPRLPRAIFAAAAMMGFEVVALALRFAEVDSLHLVTVFIQDAILFLKLWVMIYVGQVLWAREGVDYWGLERLRTHAKTVIWGGAAAVVGLTLYSTALFLWTKPTYGPIMVALGTSWPESVQGYVLLGLVLANFALAEEFIYRGCVQPMLAHWMGGASTARRVAFGLTCALWSLMHLGSLSPDWVKLVQVLPLGVFLGLWFRYAGFIGAAGAHLVFNLVMSPLGYHLITR